MGNMSGNTGAAHLTEKSIYIRKSTVLSTPFHFYKDFKVI
jgi:hypothetical protein